MSAEANRTKRQIEQLSEIRDNLTHHIKVLEEHYKRLTGESVVPEVENQWVSRIALKKYVEIYLELHERQYGHPGLQALCENAKVSRQTLKNIRFKEDQMWVSLRIADQLLQAMNMTHIIHEIDIVEGDLLNGSKWPKVPDPPFQHYEEN